VSSVSSRRQESWWVSGGSSAGFAFSRCEKMLRIWPTGKDDSRLGLCRRFISEVEKYLAYPNLLVVLLVDGLLLPKQLLVNVDALIQTV